MKRAEFIRISCMILIALLMAAAFTGSIVGCQGKGEPKVYTVGGTVSGLVGTLVLQNKSADDLSITEDGAFTFTTPIADGSSYDVTILTQPAERTCLVKNGSGTISGANITDVSITCRHWTHPSDLSDNISPDNQNAQDPEVAMDDNGDAIVVWKQSDGTNNQMFKSEYWGGVWTHPSGLTDNISPDGQHVYSPQVAMDNNGNAIVVWYQSDGANDQIFMSEYRGGTWTHPSGLSDNISPNGTKSFSPQVAMDDNGNAIVVWNQNDGANNQIFKSEYRGSAWTHPSGLSDNISTDGTNAYDSQVEMDNNGNAIVVWYQSDGTNDQIFMSEYRGGAWTHPSSLTDNISPDGTGASYPQVAMGDNGDAIVVWYQSDGANDQIFKSEYRGGSWTHPSSITDNISPDGQSAYDPQVAMDNNGDAIVVWYQSDGANDQIFMSEYRDGAWTHPSGLSDNISPDGTKASYPQVAMDNNGDAIVVWYQSDGANDQVFKSEYRSGSWTHPTGLSDNISPDNTDVYDQHVAMGDNGDAIVVWRQNDGSKTQIFISEYR